MSQQEKGGFHTSRQLFFFLFFQNVFLMINSLHILQNDGDYCFLGVCVCLQFYSQGYPSGGNCVWRWKRGARELERELERKPEHRAPGSLT